MRQLASEVRGGKFRRVVNLGTGGSDLGPRLLADALADGKLDVRFAANIDPRDLERALEGARPDDTLFVIASKTFTTQETMANAAAAKRWGGRHFFAVTANLERAKQFGALEVLPMWDWVGGRFSVWSAVGFAAMCAIGADAFQEFLEGAREIDQHFASAPLEKNIPVLMALIGVWNTDFLGCATHAVLPYANALRLLPAYLQQLEMESNGKRVDREGRTVDYSTAPVLWGAEGTVSQHSFHQLLHQGTQVVPCDFIDLRLEENLSANARAQADALAAGTDDPELPPHKQYPGTRPSSWARKWLGRSSRKETNGPGNLQPQHPQVPENGGRQLAARDRAGGAAGAGGEEALRQREPARARHARDPAARPESAVPRRDQTKIAG
jgi:glucose-6-phosphate isomerase